MHEGRAARTDPLTNQFVTTTPARIQNRPYPPLLRRLFASSVIIWLLARVVFAVVFLLGVMLFGGMPSDEAWQLTLHPVWPARVLLVLVTSFLVQLDRRFAHENLLQANFGVAPGWFVGTSLLSAGAADVAVQSILSVF